MSESQPVDPAAEGGGVPDASRTDPEEDATKDLPADPDKDIAEALQLPPIKIHCSVLAENLWNAENKMVKGREGQA